MVSRSKSHFPHSGSFEITIPLSSSIQTCKEFQRQPGSFHYFLSFCLPLVFLSLWAFKPVFFFFWIITVYLDIWRRGSFHTFCFALDGISFWKLRDFFSSEEFFFIIYKIISSLPFLSSEIPIDKYWSTWHSRYQFFSCIFRFLCCTLFKTYSPLTFKSLIHFSPLPLY